MSSVLAASETNKTDEVTLAAEDSSTVQFPSAGMVTPMLTTALAERVQLFVEERAMRAVTRPPGIAHLEHPAVLDRIALAQEVAPAATDRVGR